MKRIGRTAIYVISTVVLLCLWWISSVLLGQSLILPSPIAVFKSAVLLFQTPSFLLAVIKTSFRCFEAFLLSVVLGTVFGALSARFSWLEIFLKPWLSLVKATPVVSIILLCLFAFDSSFVPVFTAVLMAFPIMFNASCQGFSSRKEEERDFCQVFKLSKKREYFIVRIGTASSFIKNGMKTASTLVWKVVAAGEVLCIPRISLGNYLQHAQVALETQEVFAITLIIVLLSIIFEFLVDVLSLGIHQLYRLICHHIIMKEALSGKTVNHVTERDYSGIKVRSLSISYGKEGENPLYSSFNIDVESGVTTALMGPSGIGKTSLLRFMAGIAPQNSFNGEVESPDSVLLLQNPFMLKDFTVEENVCIPIQKGSGVAGRLNEILALLEIQNLAQKKVSELSGGELQRVALAQVLLYAGIQKVLLLDEPFKGLDQELKERIMQGLKTLWSARAQTVVLVVHEESDGVFLAHKIVKLNGKPVEIL